MAQNLETNMSYTFIRNKAPIELTLNDMKNRHASRAKYMCRWLLLILTHCPKRKTVSLFQAEITQFRKVLQ